MKSSTLRCSLGSIHWSGLKVPSVPSPRGIWPAILHGRSETSNFSTRLIPLLQASKRCHVSSTPHASGVSMPRPVTTTRLMHGTPSERRADRRSRYICSRKSGINAACDICAVTHASCRARPHRSSALRVFFQKFDGVAYCEDGFGGVVRYFATKLLLEGHDELDGI